MDMKTNEVQVKLDEKSGVLTLALGPNGKMSLSTEDKLDNTSWFKNVTDWETFETKGINGVKFNAHLNKDGHETTGAYTIYTKNGCPAVMVTTEMLTDDSGPVELELKWLTCKVDGVKNIHTLNPSWSIPAEKMNVAMSFREDMFVETDSGFIGMFKSGEPQFDPKNSTACPDMWSIIDGLAGYRQLRTAVIGYCESASEMKSLQTAANAFYDEVMTICRPAAKTFEGEQHKITHGHMSFTITTSKDGAALTSMKNIGEEKAFALPLTQVRLRDLNTGKEFTADTRSGWTDVKLWKENGGGRIMLSGYGEYKDFSLEIVYELCANERVEWETYVLNCEQQLSVLSASYMPAPWAADKAYCLMPEHCGYVAENTTDIHFYRDGIYPRGWSFTMSYFAAYVPKGKGMNGFYCGVCDPYGAFRTMNAETDPIEKTGIFFARLHAPGYGKGGNAFALPGKLVWQMFSGDWYDATLIYKDFIHTKATWLPAVGPEGREDTPLWAKELPVWIMDWLPNTNPLAEAVPTSINKRDDEPADTWYMDPIKFQKEIGTPVGYHVYNWHWIPFNNDYPYYLPAKKEFCENIQKLKDNNIRVMPYTNARLWDTHDKAGEDWTFTKRAKQWATKDASGKLFIEKYESHEPNGELCELAIMCPSSAVWKAEDAGIVRDLINDVGVDGVYLDQIAAAAPYLCEDPAHNHTPGGGSWWTEQYNLLIRRNRQMRGDNAILTTEDNSEVYAKAMDGFLSWIWTFDNLVPAFSVIYAGYIIMFGRTTNGLKKGDAVFLKYETAEQLVFGGQLGWMNTDILYREDEFSFLKTMTNLRYKYSPFFYKGEALRPAEITSDRPIKLTTPTYFDSRLFEAKQVLTGTWRLWDGSRTVMFIINCDDEAANFKATFAAESAELIEGAGELSGMDRDGDNLVIEGVIEPNQYLVLEIK